MKRGLLVRSTKVYGMLRAALVLVMVCSLFGGVFRRSAIAENPPIQPEVFAFPPDGGALATVSIPVSGATAPMLTMSVTISNFAAVRPDDVDILLISPGGTSNLEFWSDAGGTAALAATTITISDTGATNLSDAGPLTAGTFKPGEYSGVETGTDFGMPALTINHAQINGAATFATAFGGLTTGQLNGTWTVIAHDDATGPDAGATATKVSLTINGTTVASSSIGGTIRDDAGNPVAGTVLNLSGSQSRTAITDASGAYRFNGIETGGFYTVTPSRTNFTFTPGSRSFSQIGNQTDAAFTGSFNGDIANPVDTAEYFVRQQYLDFLGREPDEGGLAFWSSRINSCNGDAACIRHERSDVSAAFFMSGEFQQTGSFVYDMYAGLLGRNPGYGEFTPDRAQVVGGSGLDKAKQAFAESFVQRSEFTSRYPANLSREQFVDAVMQTMLDRSGADVSGLRNGLLTDYDNGGRALVARHAAESAPFVSAEYNRAFVLMEYFGYLRRGEDTNGYNFWLNLLNQGGGNNYRGMVCSFLTSTEYQGRFSLVITHGNADCSE